MATDEQLAANWDMMNTQGGRRYAYVKIMVDSGSGLKDLTDKFDPYLISVEAIHKLREPSTLSIELDDRDAQLAIPPDQAMVVAEFGWMDHGPRLPTIGSQLIVPTNPKELEWKGTTFGPVFTGKVSDCESGFARRGGGRRLWIEAVGVDVNGQGKTPTIQSWGEGDPWQGQGQPIPLMQVMSEAAAKAGYGFAMSPSLEAVARKYWYQNESFHNFGQRIAKEIGAVFAVQGNMAALIDISKGVNSAGIATTNISADWGSNLISWRIKPFAGRPQYASTRQSYFDVANGIWNSVTKDIAGALPFGRATAIAGLPAPAPNAQVGEQYNNGVAADSTGRRGTGWSIINGEPSALAGCSLIIKGARPGVDGKYLIVEAGHLYSRGGGYTTRCNVENPQPTGGFESWPKPGENT